MIKQTSHLNHRRTNKELPQRNRLEMVSKKTKQKKKKKKKKKKEYWGGCFKPFYSRETSPLILMQLQITNIFLVRIAFRKHAYSNI